MQLCVHKASTAPQKQKPLFHVQLAPTIPSSDTLLSLNASHVGKAATVTSLGLLHLPDSAQQATSAREVPILLLHNRETMQDHVQLASIVHLALRSKYHAPSALIAVPLCSQTYPSAFHVQLEYTATKRQSKATSLLMPAEMESSVLEELKLCSLLPTIAREEPYAQLALIAFLELAQPAKLVLINLTKASQAVLGAPQANIVTSQAS